MAELNTEQKIRVSLSRTAQDVLQNDREMFTPSHTFGGFLNSLLSILWVEVVGIPKLAAPIFNLLISVPLNFILNKFWAFKKKA